MTSRLVFRVDANSTIGRGHLSRCISVADMFKDEIEILFVVLTPNKEYVKSILETYPLQTISCEEEIFVIVKISDYLWIDGYQFTEEWKSCIKNKVRKLIETNDIPYHAKNVDVLVNQTPGIRRADFDKRNTTTEFHLGLNYVLLRNKFLKIARTKKTIDNGKGVFICFGGADTFHLGEKFVQALLANKFNDTIYWVTNALSKISFEKEDSNLEILSNLNVDEMIHYMTKAKVLLIPSSVLSIEGVSLRKPIFACYFVDNQKLIYDGLVSLGLAEGSGYTETINQVEMSVIKFMDYYKNDHLQQKQVEQQIESIDGVSVERIRKIIN